MKGLLKILAKTTAPRNKQPGTLTEVFSAEHTSCSPAFVSQLVSYSLFAAPVSPLPHFLITNPVARGGCAWVNRAVGACHVCSSGERSSQR